MLRVIVALTVLTFASPAVAADADILRGSDVFVPTVPAIPVAPPAYAARPANTRYHWGGVYGGVQAGYSSSVINFNLAAGPQIAYILRETAIEQDHQISGWNVLGSESTGNVGAGGFVGYNSEWEDVILGFEMNYNHVALSASSSGSLTRSFTDSTNLPTGHSYLYNLTVNSQSALAMTDIATFRARAGWEAGNFLPYGFAGVAVGRANVSTTTSVPYTAVDYPLPQVPPLTPLPNLNCNPASVCGDGPLTTGQNGAFAYGVTTGIGLDVALMPNLFVRGEIEYIYFAPLSGTQVSVASARVGVGLKY
jgi:opacity protein-like surface antigen